MVALGMLVVVAIAIFVVSMFLGTGLSSYATFSQCQKTDAKSHFKQGSIWAVYPTLAYLIMRGVGRFRVYFERFFGGWVGSERAGWVSIGYGMLLASLAGMYSMVDSSIEEVCIPTIDEATKFRQDMLKRQAEKAAAQEATPAVSL